MMLGSQYPVARKVKAATAAGGVTAAVSSVLGWALATYVLPKDTPTAITTEIVAAIPLVLTGAATFFAGFMARFEARPVTVPPPYIYTTPTTTAAAAVPPLTRVVTFQNPPTAPPGTAPAAGE